MRRWIHARWQLAVGALALAALLVAVYRLSRTEDPERAPGPAASAPHGHTAGEPHVHAPGATSSTGPDAALTATGQAAPHEPEAEPEAAAAMAGAPELPTPDEIRPRPAQPETTAADVVHNRQNALELVERSIERLEAERLAAERAGNAEIARQHQLRIERLRQRRAALQSQDQSQDTPAGSP